MNQNPMTYDACVEFTNIRNCLHLSPGGFKPVHEASAGSIMLYLCLCTQAVLASFLNLRWCDIQDPHVKLQWIHPDEVDTLPMDEAGLPWTSILLREF